MKILIYLEVKDNEHKLCKSVAYRDGDRANGNRYYLVESENLNVHHPVHPSCTCKVIVVTLLDEDKNKLEDDSLDFLEGIDDQPTAKLIKRYKESNKNFAKNNFKFAMGQEKPSERVKGWNEVVVEANIKLLDSVTKLNKNKSYEKLI